MSELLGSIVDDAVEEAKRKLKEDGYTSVEYACEDASQEVLTRHGARIDAWPQTLYEVTKGLVQVKLKSSGVSTKEDNPEDEWEGELVFVGESLEIKGDKCPECESGVLNAEYSQTAQFVHSDTWADNFHFRIDDGPFEPKLTYVSCASCEEILYER